ncbi:MFS transporter [Sulfitobacter sp. JBTF-M27]|uniref:MFS transporter n=1 Tax=Sulfitobacter sediminilitoris TaxID=2698830 RepID=A0A6P0CAM4_9RHOB|nr:TCR/Tet family MFS transporter [Sulfitobacter sediminilitoris]NEK22400.1 MFS transporter [Sulfitobacter sediminilitoris]
MRPAVIFIMITVMIDAMGIGLMIPVMPDLIREVNGGDLSQAAVWGGILATTFAAMQFLFGPIIGGLSDRYGRRKILLISLVVMAADYVVMALAGSIWLLLAGRVVGGITAATQATASAYMADISTAEQRTKSFGLIGAAFGMGFVLGPLIGGVLAEYGTRAPFWAAAFLATSNVIFGWFVLKETLAPEKARAFNWRRANPFGAVKQLGKLPGVHQLLMVYFLYNVAFAVYPSVWAYFGQERFDWAPTTIGLSLGLFGITMAFVQGYFIRVALRVFGERRTVVVGLLFALGTYTAIGSITAGWLILLLTPIAALGGITPIALQGIMSQRVADNAQGELQGALTSAVSLAMIVTPLVMTATFSYFTQAGTPFYMPGAPFLLSAMLILLGLLIFALRRRAGSEASVNG